MSSIKLRQYLLWGAFVIFLFLYLHLFQNALIDDAFITLRYAKTLLASGTWGFYPGYTANSATSPLNVILLTVISIFTGPNEEAALTLALLCFVLIALCLTRLSLRLTNTEIFGCLAVWALLLNPLLLSTLGLESILFIALFVFALYCYQAERGRLLALTLALLTLARADGVIFAGVFLIFLPTTKLRRQFILIFLVCVLPWYLFSWVRLGSVLPDTFFIKTDQGKWMNWDYFNGIPSLYYHVYRKEIILSFLFLPLVPLILYRKPTAPLLSIIGLSGLFHFVGYSLLQVPPFHWYYAPQVATIILLASLGLGVLHQNRKTLQVQRIVRFIVILGFLIPALGMISLLGKNHFALKEMPIHSNWATYEQYKDMGLWLRQGYAGQTIQLAASEIGTLSYYCNCYLLDHFSDRSWLQEYIAEREMQSGILPWFYRINFAFYTAPNFPPAQYLLRAYSSEPRDDPNIIKKVEISTKWIQHGFLVLSR